MLKDDVMNLLNIVFKKAKIPIKVNDLFIYRPVFHELPFENFEPINEAKRLGSCDPLWIEVEVEHEKHRYVYQFRCKNDKGKFIQKLRWLRMCDIFPNEDPKKLERDMETYVSIVAKILLSILELLSRE